MTATWLVGALFFSGLALLILAIGAALMWRQLERERSLQQQLTAALNEARERAHQAAPATSDSTASATSPGAIHKAADSAAAGTSAGFGSSTSSGSGNSTNNTTATAGSPFSQSEHDEQASFNYTVSHDLRAPIRVVEGFTKIVKEDYGRVMDRIGNDHLDRVLAAAARMNSMIDALLALSQLTTQPLAQQPVNLTQLAGFVADDLRRQSPERNVTLQIEPGLLAHGDPTLLRMVLENLIGNAWKYTGKCAQPMVVFERGEAMPSLNANANSNPVHTFTVRDNGAGFDMRFSDRLFGVFQRLHSANDFPGTGVGLASVRRIVRRHGGEIWADAEVDKGAAFHFSLRA